MKNTGNAQLNAERDSINRRTSMYTLGKMRKNWNARRRYRTI